MVVGLVCGVYFFLRGGPLLLAVALVGVGVLLAVVALVLRRKWAKRESENYLTQVNARVKAVVERGVSEPADEVLGRHRLLQFALGL